MSNIPKMGQLPTPVESFKCFLEWDNNWIIMPLMDSLNGTLYRKSYDAFQMSIPRSGQWLVFDQNMNWVQTYTDMGGSINGSINGGIPKCLVY